ncbi:MAG: hypothetical protein Q4C72_03280 [Eubacteriales bacterium]|nr:hypothetical protein [Eubacteriales bacterium]
MVSLGTLNMLSGKIHRGTGATGVILGSAGCTMNMSGGEITGNRGVASLSAGGVFANAGATITLSGSATITDNINSKTNSVGNLFAAPAAAINIIGNLTGTVGINNEALAYVSVGDGVTDLSGLRNDGYPNQYAKKGDDGQIAWAHPVQLDYTESGEKKTQYYDFLAKAIEAYATGNAGWTNGVIIVSQDVTGDELKDNKTRQMSGKTLTIKGDRLGRKVTFAPIDNASTVISLYKGSSLTLENIILDGGGIAGSTAPFIVGTNDSTTESGTLEMKSGAVIRNFKTAFGAVWTGLCPENKVVVNAGASITGNTSTGTPGNNYFHGCGGGVTLRSGTLTVNGGAITGNSASTKGGGVWANGVNATVVLSGNANITGNTMADKTASNIYAEDGRKVSVKADFSGKAGFANPAEKDAVFALAEEDFQELSGLTNDLGDLRAEENSSRELKWAEDYVARNERTGAQYGALSTAVAAAQAGDTVTLLMDVKLTEQVFIDKDLIIDGDGKTATVGWARIADGTGNCSVFRINNTSQRLTVTIKDLTLDGAKDIYQKQAGAFDIGTGDGGNSTYPLTVNLENVSVQNFSVKNEKGGHLERAVIEVRPHNVLHMTGGQVVNNEEYSLNWALVHADGATLNMTGVTVTGNTAVNAFLIHSNMTLTDCTITGNDIKNADGSRWLLGTNTSAQITLSGSTNITGNKRNETLDFVDTANNVGSNVCTYDPINKRQLYVVLKDFAGVAGFSGIVESDKVFATMESGKLTDCTIINDVAADMGVAQTDDKLSWDDKVAKIERTGEKYSTLKDAVTAAESDDTITLLRDIVLTGNVSVDKALTINGDGHKMSRGHAAIQFSVSADTTFQNAILDGNKANYINGKAAIYASGNVTLTLRNTVLQNWSCGGVNTGNSDKGVIRMEATVALVMTDSKLINSDETMTAWAPINGGRSAALTNVEITGNRQTSNGHILNIGGPLTLDKVTIKGNTVNTQTYAVAGKPTILKGSTVIEGNTNRAGKLVSIYAGEDPAYYTLKLDGFTGSAGVSEGSIKDGQIFATVASGGIGTIINDNDEELKVVREGNNLRWGTDAVRNQRTGKQYPAIQLAVDEADSGDTLEVLRNIAQATRVTIAGKKLTLTSAKDGPYTVKNTDIVNGFMFYVDQDSVTKASGGLTVSNLVLDGNKENTDLPGDSGYTLVEARANTSIILNEGAVLQNSRGGKYYGKSGVNVNPGATLTMNEGAVIRWNESAYGSAVSVYQGSETSYSTFIMNGGDIYENHAAGRSKSTNVGAAVDVGSYAVFEMRGGSIHDNTADTDFGKWGAGVLLREGFMKVSGSASITNNWYVDADGKQTEEAANVCLYKISQFTLDGVLTGVVGVAQSEGITGANQENTVFGVYASGGGAENIRNDVNAGLHGEISGGELKWKAITDLYVSNAGDDGKGLGTKANPYKTMDKALLEACKKTGSVIHVMDQVTQSGPRDIGAIKLRITGTNGQGTAYPNAAVVAMGDFRYNNVYGAIRLSGGAEVTVDHLTLNGNGRNTRFARVWSGSPNGKLILDEGTVMTGWQQAAVLADGDVAIQRDVTISNNKGGGIVFNSTKTNLAALSGKVVIDGNTHPSTGLSYNLVLSNKMADGTGLILSDPLQEGSKIGVTYGANRPGEKFGQNSGNYSGADYFTNDVGGYKAKANGGGLFWEEADVARLSTDGEKTWTGYPSLSAALAAADSDSNIVELLRDVTETGEMKVEKQVVLRSSTRPEEGGKVFTVTRAKPAEGAADSHLFNVTSQLTVTKLVVDGGAVWTGEKDTYLGRGTVNDADVGIYSTSGRQFFVTGAGASLTLGGGAVIQNYERKSNSGADYGGAIAVQNGASVTMEKDSAIKNCANVGANADGAAISSYTFSTTTITINGGEITGCFATRWGAVRAGGNFVMTGGRIHHNVGNGQNNTQNAGGVIISQWKEGQKLQISGDADITENYWYNEADKTYLERDLQLSAAGSQITLAGNLTGSVGVHGISEKAEDNAPGGQFGVSNGAGYAGAENFFNTVDTTLRGTVTAGNALVWAGEVARTSNDGGKVWKSFTALSAAVAEVDADNSTESVVEVLADITLDKTVAADKNQRFTLRSGTRSGDTTYTVKRGSTCTEGPLLNLAAGYGASLTVENLILDGNKVEITAPHNQAVLRTYAGNAIVLGKGAVVQNNICSLNTNPAGGVYVSGANALLKVLDGAVIRWNEAQYGAAITVNGGARIEMTGGQIYGNYASRASGEPDSGAVCITGTGSSMSLSGGIITGNGAPDAGSKSDRVGGIAVSRNGTLELSGSPVVTGNWRVPQNQGLISGQYTTGTEEANVSQLTDDSIIRLIGDFTGEMGLFQNAYITSPNEAGTKFGAAAGAYTGAERIVNDVSHALRGQRTADNLLVWAASYVARVNNGANGAWVGYASLKEAVDGLGNGSAVELLMDCTVNAEIDVTGKTFVLRSGTREEDKGNTYTVQRDINFKSSMFDLETGANVTVNNLILDGNKAQVTAGSTIFILSGGSLILNGGAVVQNNYCSLPSSTAGGIYVKSGTLNVQDGAVIRWNEAQYGSAVTVLSGAAMNMTGGEIYGNYAYRTSTTSGSGAVNVWNGALKMTGGAITGNAARASSKPDAVGGICDDGGTTNLGGAAVVTGNYLVTDKTLTGDRYTSGTAANIYVKSQRLKLDSDFTGSAGIKQAASMEQANEAGGQFGVSGSEQYTGAENFRTDVYSKLTGTLKGDKLIWAANDSVARVNNGVNGGWVEYPTLESAVNSLSQGGDTVELLRSVTQTAQLNTTKSFTLRSNSDGSEIFSTTRGAGLTGYLFHVTSGSVKVENITLDGSKDTLGATRALISIYGTNAAVTLGRGAALQNNDGGIQDNSNTAGAVRLYNGTLNMTDGAVIENCQTTNYAGAIVVGRDTPTAVFNMTGGEIRNNQVLKKAVSNNYGGGAVYIWGGVMKMSGGAIIGNAVPLDTQMMGGGVDVYSGTFEMTGGEIKENEAANGAGVGVYGSGAQTTISGSAQITDNTAANGAGLYMNSGSVTMDGGSISGNTATNGAGLYMSSGSVTMNGGTVSGNTAFRGGGVYMANGVFSMGVGAAVSGNTATAGNGGWAGGGIKILNGTAVLSGAISDNRAYDGAGVMVGQSGSGAASVTVTGKVENNGNQAAAGNVQAVYGPGVYLAGGTVTLGDGAAITGNSSATAGGGVMLHAGYGNSTLNMEGKVIVDGNRLDNGAAVDVHVYGNGDPNTAYTFNLTGALAEGSRVGVLKRGGNVQNQKFATASDAAIAEASKSYFFDNEGKWEAAAKDGVVFWDVHYVAMIVGGSNNNKQYGSLWDAVQAFNADNADHIRMVDDSTEANETSIAVKHVYLDLAGHHVRTPAVTGSYLLCGFDSTTDGYNADRDYGSLAVEKASSEHIAVTTQIGEKEDAKRYLRVQESDDGLTFSFHRYDMRLGTVVFRPTEAGIYFKSAFYGDMRVKDAIRRDEELTYGLFLGAGENADPGSGNAAAHTPDAFQNGDAGDPHQGSMITNIVVEGGANNEKNTTTPIWVGTYFNFKDASVVKGDIRSVTLTTVVKLTADKYNKGEMTLAQKTAFEGFWGKFKDLYPGVQVNIPSEGAETK